MKVSHWNVLSCNFLLCEFHWPGPWATWFLDGPVEWKAGQKWSKVCKWKSAQVGSGSNTFQLLARMSMMAALGQLAKDGSLLAPTHKHIGISQFTPIFCSYPTYIHIIAQFLIFNFIFQLNAIFHCKALVVDFSDYKEALGKSLAGFLPAKYIFKVGQILKVQNQNQIPQVEQWSSG